MGIIDKLKNLLPAKAPMTSGATKAAAGRSDLAHAASKLDEIRGDNLSINAEAAGHPAEDKMAKLVEGAKTIRTVNARGEGKILGE
ncbi:MAG: hypothetical protein ACI81L_000582 [Verrucomicrobiales bacterium]|jgi:hypothetical protein